MQNRDKSNKRLVELLWIEINRAIINSKDVKTTLANLRELNLLNDIKEYNLVLDINKLIELTAMEIGDNNSHKKLESESYPEDGNPDFWELQDEAESRQAPIASEEQQNNRQHIDGKPMSKNQILFQEYQERQFDNSAWLKKARIYF